MKTITQLARGYLQFGCRVRYKSTVRDLEIGWSVRIPAGFVASYLVATLVFELNLPQVVVGLLAGK